MKLDWDIIYMTGFMISKSENNLTTNKSDYRLNDYCAKIYVLDKTTEKGTDLNYLKSNQ